MIAAIVLIASVSVGQVKVAFIGDQGLGSNAEDVLQLIADEGADAVVHAGDYDYDDCPSCWLDQIHDFLPVGYPYFAVLGNHEDNEVSGYKAATKQLLDAAGVDYHGDPGELASWEWSGIYFVSGAPDVLNDGDDDCAPYFDERLAQTDAPWRVAFWHVVMEAMQIGGKDDQSGWGVYETSRERGAICATAHEHSYARTHLLSSMQDQIVVDDDFDYVLSEGETIAFHSGMAGRSIRDQERCLPTTPPYGCNGEWASVYAEQQGADYGALFITFGWQGDPCRAYGYFKDINGDVIDEFFLTSAIGLCAGGCNVIGQEELAAYLENWPDSGGAAGLLDLLASWGQCE